MGKPLAIDLFCGLGGWAEGFLAEGYDVVGFDNHRHVYGSGDSIQKYPAQLVLQNVLTLDGRQLRNAAVIVASPPCTEYSYMAMPWSRGKQIARALRGEGEFPESYTGSRTIEDLNRLFDACFRIAKEAGVPLVVENVKGAQPWVGEARAHFGSFYLWGDVNSVGNAIVGPSARFGEVLRARRGAEANNGRKVPMNFHEFEKTGKPGRSFQSVAVEETGRKLPEGHDTFAKNGKPCNKLTDPAYGSDGNKQGGNWWHDPESLTRKHSSRSAGRKAASAQIAKIPFPLAQYIARVFKP